jgi:hypothetical protein
MKDTHNDDIKQYLVVNNVYAISTECVSNDNATYCSFNVEIKVSDLSNLLDVEVWPSGVHGRRYYKKGKPETAKM